MKIGARARLTLVVMIGVIAGLGFISLPSILAVPSAPSTPSPTTRSGTNSTSGTTTSFGGSMTTQNATIMRVQLTNGTKTLVPAPTTITPDALTALVTLIVVPALAFSWVAAVLVSSRARKVLGDTSEEESSQENSNGP